MNDASSSSSDPARRRPASTKGKLRGPKPPLRVGHVWSIRARLQLERRIRDLALFNLAIELTEVTRQALDDYLRISDRKLDQCLFPGRRGPDRHLTTRQYARLVSEWVGGIGLDPLKYATHSMRRTKATLIYRRTGNLRAVQLLLGHTKIESTVRYLGVEIDDALDIAEKIEV